MAVDRALREHLITPGEIRRALRTAWGWPYVRRARDVLALGCPLAESPLESIVRLALHDDDFPAPVLQPWIAGYRVDLYLPEHRLVIEADGRGKYTGDELWREKQREHSIASAGERVERVIWGDMFDQWPRTSARLRQALRLPVRGG